MAMIDYGAIGFKNGKLISTEMFTPMIETCGFSDWHAILPGESSSFDGNYFLVIGNEQLLIGFYKETISWWTNNSYRSNVGEEDRYETGAEWFNCSRYEKWKQWTEWISSAYYAADIVVKPKNSYYVAKILIGDTRVPYRDRHYDKYKIYFGNGVDLNFYKKTRRVNYYRSPEYFISKLSYKLSYKIKRFFSHKRKGD